MVLFRWLRGMGGKWTREGRECAATVLKVFDDFPE